MPGSLFEQIYALTRRIPMGQVATYGQIARAALLPRGARTVGFAMAACRDPSVPCHRVVDRLGRTKPAFDVLDRDVQRRLLEAEGVVFLADGRVDLARCQCADDEF